MFKPERKTLVVGTGPLVRDLLAEICRKPGCKYRIIGVVTPPGVDAAGGGDYRVLGPVDDLHRIIREHKPEVVIVAPPDRSAALAERQLLEARVLQNVDVEHAQAVYEQVTGKLPLEAFAPEDIIYSDDFQPSRAALLSTRLLSFAAAGAGVMILSPLMLLIALAIRLDSAGPVLFVQERTGMGGRPFNLLKFRTMRTSNQRESEWEEDNLHRITRVGRWLRKTRADELPQFFNVLRGEMNLVGPRPHPVSNFELFVLAARNTPDSGLQIPYYSMRYSVRPGITGWAQVRYRYANNLHEELEKLRFDLYYLKHYSLWLDVRILIETAIMVLPRRKEPQDQPSGAGRDTNRPDVTEEIRPSPGEAGQQDVRTRDVA